MRHDQTPVQPPSARGDAQITQISATHQQRRAAAFCAMSAGLRAWPIGGFAALSGWLPSYGLRMADLLRFPASQHDQIADPGRIRARAQRRAFGIS
jgi:hypothetical protein